VGGGRVVMAEVRLNLLGSSRCLGILLRMVDSMQNASFFLVGVM
jgi:hypothetical protein